MIQTKIAERIKTQIVCSITFFPWKLCHLWNKCGKIW